jgi:hypothetical protein
MDGGAGAIPVTGAILILKVAGFGAFHAGIILAIFISFPAILTHAPLFKLLCIPGSTPVSTSRVKSIFAAEIFGAAAGPAGTTTALTSDIAAVAVGAVRTYTVV